MKDNTMDFDFGSFRTPQDIEKDLQEEQEQMRLASVLKVEIDEALRKARQTENVFLSVDHIAPVSYDLHTALGAALNRSGWNFKRTLKSGGDGSNIELSKREQPDATSSSE